MGACATQRFAAIDIGTVTCRMLVADVDECGALHELDREYRIVNLGEGVDATGLLKPEAIARTAQAVSDFLQVLERFREDGHNIPVTAVATSASRDARNASDFAAALEGAGVSLSVISGAQEAALSFSGASCGFRGEQLFVVDVGGGSTEVVAGLAGESPRFSHSFDIGCRRVTERFLHDDPPRPVQLDQARAWVRDQMQPFFAQIQAQGFRASRLVAVAGTATSVVAIRERMEHYDTARVHGAEVSRANLDAVYDQVRLVPCEQRRAIVGLDPGRAPVITAGLLILQTVLDLAGADSFTVSEADILHGIILAASARL